MKMKILSILLLIPTVALAKFTLKDKMIQPFQLNNQNMREFITDYADIVEKPLLVNKKTIKGKVNFSIVNPISLEDFHKMFLTVLSSQGIAVVEDEAFLRVISERDVRYTPSKLYMSDNFPKSDQHIMVKYDLKNPLANEISRNIRPFISRYGRIISFNNGHTLIISDKGNNINRILKVVNSLDHKFDLEAYIANKELRRKRKEKAQKIDEVEALQLENMILKKEMKKLKKVTNEAGRL
jgi:type II secretory pathway component GspD/PulD (secretin)